MSSKTGYRIMAAVLVAAIVVLFALTAQAQECEKFYRHSGQVPAGWTATFTEDGQSYGPYVGPTYVDPGTAHEGNRTWDKAIKCKTPPETTTTTSSTSTTEATTTTTEGTTTTTSSMLPSSTTTTLPPESTTTTLARSTTTDPAGTTTQLPDTSTTPPAPTTTAPTESTTTTIDPPDELPMTGSGGLAVPLAFAALGLGVGTLGYARRRWSQDA